MLSVSSNSGLMVGEALCGQASFIKFLSDLLPRVLPSVFGGFSKPRMAPASETQGSTCCPGVLQHGVLESSFQYVAYNMLLVFQILYICTYIHIHTYTYIYTYICMCCNMYCIFRLTVEKSYIYIYIRDTSYICIWQHIVHDVLFIMWYLDICLYVMEYQSYIAQCILNIEYQLLDIE